ncbi:hypothetical protein PM082_009308 [Marasmius tenuissimus]|nr:hypothetical protein PM082_009308 [Marasmius tenuissimus]
MDMVRGGLWMGLKPTLFKSIEGGLERLTKWRYREPQEHAVCLSSISLFRLRAALTLTLAPQTLEDTSRSQGHH